MAHNVIHWGEVNALKFLKKLISLLMYNPGCSCHFPQCTFTYSIFPFLHPQLLHSISAFSDSWSSLFLLVQVIDFVFQSSNFESVLPLYHSSCKPVNHRNSHRVVSTSSRVWSQGFHQQCAHIVTLHFGQHNYSFIFFQTLSPYPKQIKCPLVPHLLLRPSVSYHWAS